MARVRELVDQAEPGGPGPARRQAQGQAPGPPQPSQVQSIPYIVKMLGPVRTGIIPTGSVPGF